MQINPTFFTHVTFLLETAAGHISRTIGHFMSGNKETSESPTNNKTLQKSCMGYGTGGEILPPIFIYSFMYLLPVLSMGQHALHANQSPSLPEHRAPVYAGVDQLHF